MVRRGSRKCKRGPKERRVAGAKAWRTISATRLTGSDMLHGSRFSCFGVDHRSVSMPTVCDSDRPFFYSVPEKSSVQKTINKITDLIFIPRINLHPLTSASDFDNAAWHNLHLRDPSDSRHHLRLDQSKGRVVMQADLSSLVPQL